PPVTRTVQLLAMAALVAFATRAAHGAPAPPETTTVVLLGTGMPNPDPAAQGPATAITVGDRVFLFDAGPGVVRQLSAAGLHVRAHPLTAVFLTHLNSDHPLGLPDVILTT